MSNYIIKQQDIDILRQSNKQIFSKIELLNHNFKIIDSIEGNLISDSFSIDSNSTIRRTYNCEIYLSDKSLVVGANKKIWIDKFIRPYIGIIHQRSNEIVWYLMGTFTFNDNTYSFDSTSRNLSMKCDDLMCTLNGDRGGGMEGLNIKIDANAYIRDVLVSLMKDAGMAKYRIEDIGKTIPHDLKYETGTTYYQILKDIVELYAGYQMYFDVEGVFVIEKIPTLKSDGVILDENIINPLIISEQTNNSFNNVYNVTQVWGSTIDTDYYSQSSSSIDGTAYTAIVDKVIDQLDNFKKYSVKICITNKDNPTINLNNLGAKKIVNDNGEGIPKGRLFPNTDYVFKYRKATDDFLLLGQYQAYGEFKQTASDCIFSTTNLKYEIKQVLSFDNLESDDLCQQRAEYETWLSTRMQDSTALNMVCIPFLDVNSKISYTSFITEMTGDYIIKSISGSNSDFTMNLTMITFSELYPDIVGNT
ncbi:DUF5048 domain-containing protein [Anaerocolumna xylanovorans]|uniref:DUF5048 domain-containing protein n=1 Tax=Anaerocolumna xylanovorans DSM 12503 TaxID=1121345 RepID=A0A1M7YM52_9FIRM|nr:DUF5048 domain-containing protein [Anaerocolumna xylanovorans]SHO53704.1 protein of unknown function [Anaerocolumna xylanovorans DSM 12503]